MSHIYQRQQFFFNFENLHFQHYSNCYSLHLLYHLFLYINPKLFLLRLQLQFIKFEQIQHGGQNPVMHVQNAFSALQTKQQHFTDLNSFQEPPRQTANFYG